MANVLLQQFVAGATLNTKPYSFATLADAGIAEDVPRHVEVDQEHRSVFAVGRRESALVRIHFVAADLPSDGWIQLRASGTTVLHSLSNTLEWSGFLPDAASFMELSVHVSATVNGTLTTEWVRLSDKLRSEYQGQRHTYFRSRIGDKWVTVADGLYMIPTTHNPDTLYMKNHTVKARGYCVNNPAWKTFKLVGDVSMASLQAKFGSGIKWNGMIIATFPATIYFDVTEKVSEAALEHIAQYSPAAKVTVEQGVTYMPPTLADKEATAALTLARYHELVKVLREDMVVVKQEETT